ISALENWPGACLDLGRPGSGNGIPTVELLAKVGLPTWHFKDVVGVGRRLFPLILRFVAGRSMGENVGLIWAGKSDTVYNIFKLSG
nr:hypothetical protein [Tanacetum cinerariifolium]